MDQASKRRGRPLPDAINIKPIAFNLEEALAVENLYRPNLLVIQHDLKPWEVTLNSRDGAVLILRFLRFWFDVPQTVFFSAVTYLDLFLARMKVQEKYLNCLTISCFYVAAVREDFNVDVNQLVAVSQNRCSVKDMLRMAGIVKEKLKLDNNDNDRNTTCAEFLLIYLEILEYITTHRGAKIQASEVLEKQQLLTRLEVLLADSSCAFFRSSTLCLVLIKLEIEKVLPQALANKSYYFVGELLTLITIVRELQITCKIKSAELMNCSNNANKVLKQYDSYGKTKYNQHLWWRFSASTIDKINKFRKYHLSLDTIEENQKFSQKKFVPKIVTK